MNIEFIRLEVLLPVHDRRCSLSLASEQLLMKMLLIMVLCHFILGPHLAVIY